MNKTTGTVINPALINEGDTLRVEFPAVNGLKATYEGVVHNITAHGEMRRCFTKQGAILLSWSINGARTKPTITRLKAAPLPHSELPGFDLGEFNA